MKKQLAVILTLAAVAVSAKAQGFFNFANGASGVNAPVFETDGTTKLTSAYKADFYWANGTVSTQSAFDAAVAAGGSTGGIGSLTGGTTPVSFSGNGIFLGGTQNITTAGVGATVTMQVKAWRASDGATFAIAAAAPGSHAGQGNLIQLALGSGAQTVPNMVGLTSFNLQSGPEPATIALGLMGAGALFIRRRKV